MTRLKNMARRCVLLTGALTLSCTAGRAPDPVDHALVLDGEGWATFPDAGDAWDLVPGGERTFSLWVRYTRPQYHAKILYKNTPLEETPSRGYVVFVHQYSTSLGFWHRSGVPLDESGYTQAGTAGTRKIGDGDWHHVAVVQRDTLVEGWVDGRLEFLESISRTLPDLATDTPLQLGWGSSDRVRFAGEIDEFSLWHRALSRGEIRRLRYRSPNPDAPGLAGYWPMDEGAGNTLTDRTGHGLDGTGTALRWSQASRPLAPPFRERPTFFLLVASVALLLLYGILRLYGRRLERQKRKLEQQVEARVADLARTNAEKDEALALVASQAQRLKEVNDTRAHFFTNISHEFRTPLSLIVGPLSDTLDRGGDSLDEEARQAMAAALRSGRRLGHLTSQLLDLARLETQTLRMDQQPTDFRQLLLDLAQSFRIIAEREDVEVRVSMPDEALVVEGDHHRLETVFSNLLSNAVRFTPPGKEVLLEARVAKGQVTVEVRDQGPGIQPDAQERIFERFYQTPAGVRQGGGMGVGLALVRELVELHGGSVRAESAPDGGAAFLVVLPLSDMPVPADVPRVSVVAAATPGSPGAPYAPHAHETPDGWRHRPPTTTQEAPEPDDPDHGDRVLPPQVLVVEDHPELRDFVSDHLSRHFRVAQAGDGNTALEAARVSPPDVIVSDVMMPGMDGLELLTRLREDPDIASIPLILLTSKAELTDRLTGLERGADDYLAKPFEPLELTARIRAILESHQRLRRRLMAELDQRASPPGEGGPADAQAGAAPDPGGYLRERLRQVVEEHLGDPNFTVSDLASHLAMERTGLYKTMTAELGTSPSDFMREIRLKRAADLLREGNTVADVAYAVGYGSVSSFSRRFSEHFGCSPGRWATEGSRRPA